MKLIAGAFSSGVIFGLGLAVSEMTDPARVTGFLDLAGAWDPTLVFVMGGALLISLPGFALILRRPRPLLGAEFMRPTKKDIDAPLVGGAAIFGVGWGLSGFCPGPAIAALSTLSPAVVLFVAAMIAGQWLASRAELRLGMKVPTICDDE
jgi:uncharacterized protein